MRTEIKRMLAVCGCLWSFFPWTGHAQLVMAFEGSRTISESSPDWTLSLRNSGNSSLSLGGVSFFVAIGGGLQGPTLKTAGGLDLAQCGGCHQRACKTKVQ